MNESSWKQAWNAISIYRSNNLAPVDFMGCNSCSIPSDPPISKRFSILVALLFSSQTKDSVTFAAVKKLRDCISPDPLSPLSIVNCFKCEDESSIQRLESILTPVSFYKRKAMYLMKVSKILVDKYAGDVPTSVEELLQLPGIGMKMAQLCLYHAWGKSEGISVDTHVHRITNRLGWVSTKSPDETRKAY